MYVSSNNQNSVSQSSFNTTTAVGNNAARYTLPFINKSIDQVYNNLSLATQAGNSLNSSSVNNSLNTALFTQAYKILDSNLSDENKALALADIGLSTNFASNALGKQGTAGANVILDIAQTAANWGGQSDEDRINSVAQIVTNAGSTLGASAAGVASILTGGYQIVQGFEQVDDIIDVVNDLPRSQALKNALPGLSLTGASIGLGVAGTSVGVGLLTGTIAASGVGSALLAAGATFGPIGLALGAVGALVSSFTGSGKSTSQKMRDGWRDSLEQQGLAQVIDGSHHVTLADGSLYDIGVDGGNKLPNVGLNVDGNIERHTFDVDFSNEVTAGSIPEGHLFAIASGLDPTSHEDHGLFESAMAQALNAATSNARSVEEVRANYRAMLGNTGPEQIGMRLEVLRATNKITDREYGVYIHHLNKMYGTSFVPSDGAQAKEFLAAQIAQKPQAQWSEGEQELFLQLTDPVKIQEAEQDLQERLANQAADSKVFNSEAHANSSELAEKLNLEK